MLPITLYCSSQNVFYSPILMVFSAPYKLLLVISFVCGWSSVGEDDLALEWGFIFLYFFIIVVNYLLSRIYFVCISRVKCHFSLYPCGHGCTHRGPRKLEVFQDFAQGFWHVNPRDPQCQQSLWDLSVWAPQTLPEGVIKTFPHFLHIPVTNLTSLRCMCW